MPSSHPIVIGQVTSLTGPNYMGLENRDGAELAVQQLNDAGGLLDGRRVELRVEDDASLPQGAVDAYHRLAEQGVAAVVGTSFSNASLAVLPRSYSDTSVITASPESRWRSIPTVWHSGLPA